MGGNVDTGQQSTGLTNPAMQAAATTIGNQLNTQLSQGVRPFTGSLAPDLSSQTMAGVNALGNNPATGAFTNAIGGTIGDLGAVASGRRFGMNDPGYAALRAGLADDVTTNVNATLQGSGRFGSQSHEGALTRELATSLGGLDYQNFQNDQQRQMQAAGMLPGLYQGSMLPASAQLQGGQILDAQALARAQDAERLFDVTNNAGWNTLQRGASIFAGTAPTSGTTTTQSQPWWKVGTGLAATGLGFL